MRERGLWVLGVKGKILMVDLPHWLRAEFDGLFKLFFGVPV